MKSIALLLIACLTLASCEKKEPCEEDNTGSLRINNKENLVADVYLDNTYRGTVGALAPITFENITAGNVLVKLEYDNFILANDINIEACRENITNAMR